MKAWIGRPRFAASFWIWGETSTEICTVSYLTPFIGISRKKLRQEMKIGLGSCGGVEEPVRLGVCTRTSE